MIKKKKKKSPPIFHMVFSGRTGPRQSRNSGLQKLGVRGSLVLILHRHFHLQRDRYATTMAFFTSLIVNYSFGQRRSFELMVELLIHCVNEETSRSERL